MQKCQYVMDNSMLYMLSGFCSGRVLAYITPCMLFLRTGILPKRMFVRTALESWIYHAISIFCLTVAWHNSTENRKSLKLWIMGWQVSCQHQPTSRARKIPCYCHILRHYHVAKFKHNLENPKLYTWFQSHNYLLVNKLQVDTKITFQEWKI